MYSGTTLRGSSGNILGAHQKINRVARRQLKQLLPVELTFPLIKEIQHFEGINGPDGIKRKSPSRDEPWHYIDPEGHEPDHDLLGMIEDHHHNLIVALRAGEHTRAAFEAAWLSHAIVDGLTPAHHYPLSDKIEELWGHPKEERLTLRQKNLIRGSGRRDTIAKNWQYWGAKGVFTTHFMFEMGFATTIAPMRFHDTRPSGDQLVRASHEGIANIFSDALRTVHSLGMYEEFHRKGWTRRLARLTRQELAPTIIRTVELAWYSAAIATDQAKKK